MNTKLSLVVAVIGIVIAVAVSPVLIINQASAKSLVECQSKNNCQGNLDQNHKCQVTHAGNSENSKIKDQTPGCTE